MINKTIVAIAAVLIIAVVSMFTIGEIRIVYLSLIIVSGLSGFAIWQKNNMKKQP